VATLLNAILCEAKISTVLALCASKTYGLQL